MDELCKNCDVCHIATYAINYIFICSYSMLSMNPLRRVLLVHPYHVSWLSWQIKFQDFLKIDELCKNCDVCHVATLGRDSPLHMRASHQISAQLAKWIILVTFSIYSFSVGCAKWPLCAKSPHSGAGLWSKFQVYWRSG